jgi:hypothetical protein
MCGTSPVCLVILVYLVHLVRLMQPNKPDRPNRPNEQDRLADLFSILLDHIIHDGSSRNRVVAKRDGRAEPRGREASLNRMSTD